MAVGRVVVTHPWLLPADVSTGDLNADSESAVLEILSSQKGEFQNNVVMVTHDLKAATYTKTTHCLEKGTIQRTEEASPAKARSFLLLPSQT